MPTCTHVAFKTTYFTNRLRPDSNSKLNQYTNAINITLITRHNIRIFIYKITKASILLRANANKNLRTYTTQFKTYHPQLEQYNQINKSTPKLKKSLVAYFRNGSNKSFNIQEIMRPRQKPYTKLLLYY